MVALAEEEGVAGAISDVRNANAAVNPEDAVPRDIRKRPRAGVAAITAHPIETPGPRGGAPWQDFHHVCWQRIRGANQELDDLGLGGVPAPGDIVAVIEVVPLVVQAALLEVGEQLDPQVGSPVRTVAN